MPSFIAREPIFLTLDGTKVQKGRPGKGARCIAAAGQVVSEAMQEQYGIENPDLAESTGAEPERD